MLYMCITKFIGVSTVPFPVPVFETNALCKLYIMKCACDLWLAISRPVFPWLHLFLMLVYVCVLCCEYTLVLVNKLQYYPIH